VGTIKSTRRIYQQTFIDTYAKVALAKLYDRRNALVAADMLNDQVLPFYEEQDVPLLRVLTDRDIGEALAERASALPLNDELCQIKSELEHILLLAFHNRRTCPCTSHPPRSMCTRRDDAQRNCRPG
jgi:hypothetical protein